MDWTLQQVENTHAPCYSHDVTENVIYQTRPSSIALWSSFDHFELDLARWRSQSGQGKGLVVRKRWREMVTLTNPGGEAEMTKIEAALKTGEEATTETVSGWVTGAGAVAEVWAGGMLVTGTVVETEAGTVAETGAGAKVNINI